ncbi:MAG: VOC family protein, partial [Defluviitaleaceae bacterium]|nr:VOC family protein [Defluviitaleaceae bacterium]
PNSVMHSEVLIFGTKITMTDGGTGPITGGELSLMLSLDSVEAVTSAFNKLAEDEQVTGALAPQFWAALCGDVQDRFGIHWHICTNF